MSLSYYYYYLFYLCREEDTYVRGMKEVKRPKCPLPLDNQKNTRRNAARRTAWKRYYNSLPLPKEIREEGMVTRELQNRQAHFVQVKLGQMTYRERYWYAAIKAALSKAVSDYWVMMNYEFLLGHDELRILCQSSNRN